MILRFFVQNLLSFYKETEFNMLPAPRLSRLSHHKYDALSVQALKMAAIYGANGAGKSNLVKAISLLKQLVITGNVPNEFKYQKFRLAQNDPTDFISLGIEFIHNNVPFYFSVKIKDGIFMEEILLISGLGKSEDNVLFQRTVSSNGTSEVRFSNNFEKKNENNTLKSVIVKELLKPDKSLFFLLQELSNEEFDKIKIGYKWFQNELEIVFPRSRPNSFVNKIDNNEQFKSFANNIVRSLNTGINEIGCHKITIEEFFGEDSREEIDEIKADLQANPKKIYHISPGIEIVNEAGQFLAKSLFLIHLGKNNRQVIFKPDEVSDGTRRLLDYIQLFGDIIYTDKVYFVDEIERSIHPLAVKELVTKFSVDNNTHGQLIFTTHESNILDQDILRQDEIWFAEKNKQGATEFYPLSEFKEHHTIDIRKGYLNGRYGAIPFLGNLHDLKWNDYDPNK